jgi:hypothetical protein
MRIDGADISPGVADWRLPEPVITGPSEEHSRGNLLREMESLQSPLSAGSVPLSPGGADADSFQLAGATRVTATENVAGTNRLSEPALEGPPLHWELVLQDAQHTAAHLEPQTVLPPPSRRTAAPPHLASNSSVSSDPTGPRPVEALPGQSVDSASHRSTEPQHMQGDRDASGPANRIRFVSVDPERPPQAVPGAPPSPTPETIATAGTVDPFSGEVHLLGEIAYVCRRCQVAYKETSVAALRTMGDRCFSCRGSFRRGLPRRTTVTEEQRIVAPKDKIPVDRRSPVTRAPSRDAAVASAVMRPTTRFRAGQRVRHSSFGNGTVVRVEARAGGDDIVYVDFPRRPGGSVLILANFLGLESL